MAAIVSGTNQGLMGRIVRNEKGLKGRILQRGKIPPASQSARERAEQARKVSAYLYSSAPNDVIYESVFCHYCFMDEAIRTDGINAIVSDKFILWSHQKDEVSYTINLRTETEYPTEGELSLDFRKDGKTLYILSFSFVPSCFFSAIGLETVLVGRMQGVRNAFNDVKAATKALLDISPQAVLFAALRGIALALGIPVIVGVSAATHLKSGFASVETESLARHYDRFFETVDAARVDDFYLTAVSDVPRSMQNVRADHRRRTAAKRAFKHELCMDVSRVFGAVLCLPQPGEESLALPRSGVSAYNPSLGLSYAQFRRYMFAAAENDEKKSEILHLRSQIDIEGKEKASLARMLAEAEGEILASKAKIASLNEGINDLSNQVILLSDENLTLKREILRLSEESTEKTRALEAEISNLTRDYHSLSDEIRAVNVALSEEKHAATVALQASASEFNALGDRFEETVAGIVSRMFRRFPRKPPWMPQKQYEYRVLKNGIFDPEYYLEMNRDVAEASRDPVRHYQEFGYLEGRDPNRFFSSANYLKAYPDVLEAGRNPLVHYCLHGVFERRRAIFGV